MRKLTLTLVCAFAVLVFADPASAEIYTVSDDEIDEFLEKLGAEDLDEDLLDSQLDGVNGGFLDSCVDCRPVCYAVSFQHGSSWTVITGGDVYWNSFDQVYGVCYDEDAMTDVDGVRQSWKTTSSARLTCCSYCSSGTFTEGHYKDLYYYLMADTRSCAIDAGNSYVTLYMAEELSYYNDYDFNWWTNYRIGRMYTPTPSYVNVAYCPD
jgi:hypothetical protein